MKTKKYRVIVQLDKKQEGVSDLQPAYCCEARPSYLVEFPDGYSAYLYREQIIRVYEKGKPVEWTA